MFKVIVFACLLAFAAASPAPAPGGLLARQLYTAPLAYSYGQPSYIASAPLAYSSAYTNNLAWRSPLAYSASVPAITYL